MGTIWVQCSVICAMKSERKIEEEKNKVKVETTTNRYEGTIKSNESQLAYSESKQKRRK